MEFIGFLNDVTGGELLLWKVIAATTVFALAGFQVLMAARFWQATPFPYIGGVVVGLHRRAGRVAAVACRSRGVVVRRGTGRTDVTDAGSAPFDFSGRCCSWRSA